MIPAILLLCASAVLGYLSMVDRMSPPAMQIVELETAIGIPLWGPVGVVGLGLLVWSLWPKPPPLKGHTETKERQRKLRDRPEEPLAEGWRPTLDARALRLPIEPQGKVKIDEAKGVPYTLVLRNATPQQARSRYAIFAELLSSMPTPPAARVRIESSPDIGGPIHKTLAIELDKFFPADAFQVLSRSDGADVRFERPDPRWTSG